MAASFKIGQMVKLNTILPQGDVTQLSIDPEGNITYLVNYTDDTGQAQARWFTEDTLVAV